MQETDPILDTLPKTAAFLERHSRTLAVRFIVDHNCPFVCCCQRANGADYCASSRQLQGSQQNHAHGERALASA